jgi:hypothetical protein
MRSLKRGVIFPIILSSVTFPWPIHNARILPALYKPSMLRLVCAWLARVGTVSYLELNARRSGARGSYVRPSFDYLVWLLIGWIDCPTAHPLLCSRQLLDTPRPVRQARVGTLPGLAAISKVPEEASSRCWHGIYVRGLTVWVGC